MSAGGAFDEELDRRRIAHRRMLAAQQAAEEEASRQESLRAEALERKNSLRQAVFEAIVLDGKRLADALIRQGVQLPVPPDPEPAPVETPVRKRKQRRASERWSSDPEGMPTPRVDPRLPMWIVRRSPPETHVVTTSGLAFDSGPYVSTSTRGIGLTREGELRTFSAFGDISKERYLWSYESRPATADDLLLDWEIDVDETEIEKQTAFESWRGRLSSVGAALIEGPATA